MSREIWDVIAENNERTLRLATRNAPSWVIRDIERRRSGTGVAQKRSEAKRTSGIVLVGACSPGLSEPVLCANDGLRLVEMVAFDACDHCLRQVRARSRNVELRAGHLGDVITDTASGGLDLIASPGTGLMMVAHVPVTRDNGRMLACAMGGTMRLSISFVPRRTELVRHNGRRVRLFREIDLEHVAALWDDQEHGVPCFRAAKVFASFAHDKAAVRKAMKAASVFASTAEMQKGWH